MERRRFRIEGEVHGVGFRFWTQRQAERIGVSGTVCNRADGSVAVEAAGGDEQLDLFETLLREGPPHARVTAVRRETPTSEPLPPRFEIVRE
jgi:acylphosphatase